MKAPPAIFVDGFAWVMIGIFTMAVSIFTGEEAAKLISALPLFIIKVFCQMNLAGWSALKMFRSTAFAEHLKKVNGGDTTFFGREVDKTKT